MTQASHAKWANWPWRWGVEPCHCATRLTGCAPALPELQKRLIRQGASLGGARLKSLISLEGEAWLVKFSEGEDIDTPLIEHATMELARACGIEVATTRALPIGSGHAVAIKRFDRNGPMRVHVVSAHVALRAAGEAPGYPQLAQLLRRVAPAEEIRSQQAQLFRRMVFNILIDNTDDHEKTMRFCVKPMATTGCRQLLMWCPARRVWATRPWPLATWSLNRRWPTRCRRRVSSA